MPSFSHLSFVVLSFPTFLFADDLSRVSVDVDGVQADQLSINAELSADGRLAVFSSRATNLVPDDTNDAEDVFVKDRLTGDVFRVSVASDGTEGNGDSSGGMGAVLVVGGMFINRPDITPDGRFVAFASEASNLVVGDTNDSRDIFVHDRVTGITERVSVASDGAEANGNANPIVSISDDGNLVAFASVASYDGSDTQDDDQIYLHDRAAGTTTRITFPDPDDLVQDSAYPDVSGDGSRVVFASAARGLTDDDPEFVGVYLYDVLSADITLLSTQTDGTAADRTSSYPRISRNGEFVTYYSFSDEIVDDDDNTLVDLFRHEIATGENIRISEAVDGTQADDESYFAAIGPTGNRVVMISRATNLLEAPIVNDQRTQVYLRDLAAGTMTLVSHGLGGEPADFSSVGPAISGDGSVVAFTTRAANLVDNDTNRTSDVFATGNFSPEPELQRFEYAAKVVCGVSRPGDTPRMAPGFYATSINIHNPDIADVSFFKKLARAIPPGGQVPGGIFPIGTDTLAYDEALNSDCVDLRTRLFPASDPSDFFEGFLVVQSPEALDVTAVYSTAGVDRSGQVTGHSSIDVEVIPARDRAEGCDVELTKEVSEPLPPYEFGGLQIRGLRYDISISHTCDFSLTDVEVVDVIETEIAEGALLAVPIIPLIEPVIVEPGGAFELVDHQVMPDSTTEATMRAEIDDIAPGENGLLAYWVVGVKYGDYYGGVVRNTATVSSAAFELSFENNTASTETPF